MLGATVVVLTLAACTTHPDPHHRAPEAPIEAARELADAPDWVAEPAGTDCGEAELDHCEVMPTPLLDCIASAAAAGASAHAAWVSPTTEGDPVPSFIRVGDGEVETASTLAFDAYGGPGWSLQRCGIDALEVGEQGPACRSAG